MNTTTRVTIPMDNTLRRGLKQKADDFGFDSIQALLRYVSKAVIDGRPVTFSHDDWGEPPVRLLKRWEKQLTKFEADKKAGKVKSYTSADDIMADLRKA